MAKPFHQLLAKSLERVKKKSEKHLVQAAQISRLDRERLEKEGWLTPIIKGWYLLNQPILVKGESTYWYSSFWDFISVYLKTRFGNKYCLSANDSLHLHLGNTTIPKQLLVLTQEGGSSVIHLPFNTSLVIYQENNTFPQIIDQVNNINTMPLAMALHRIPANFFQQQPNEAELALKLVDLTSLSRELLNGSNMASANRIMGAYNFMSDTKSADLLKHHLIAAGYSVNPVNPFTISQPALSNYPRMKSPYSARISILWERMREQIISIFPEEPGINTIANNYFEHLEKIYVNDAYNSLSIEGYEVSEELIIRVANGEWNPDIFDNDKNQVNAMAAKGYRIAFEAVKKSIGRIFNNEIPGEVIKDDLPLWYSALFSPAVKAGLLEQTHLAGYRNQAVYIRGSMHTPLPKDALMDAMDTFFKCLINEKSAAVRAILGHFIFVFIHPYMDGNGRIGRFIMNALFASGGFPWTIVTVAHREAYLKSLEKASVEQDIGPFTKFILDEMKLEK